MVRSGCKIEALKTRDGISDSVFIGLLEEMPTLWRLSIREPRSLPMIIKRIAYNPFLPDLTYLECIASKTAGQVIDHVTRCLSESSFMKPLDGNLTMSEIVM